MGRYFLIMALVAGMLTGCGALGGSKPDSGSSGQVEQTTITVAVLTTVETAPLQLAVRNGYFRDQGLDVKVAVAASGQATVTGMINGEYDVGYSSYPPIIAAQAKKAADLRLVADNSFAAPNTAVVVKPAQSPLSSIKDLAGKTVAVTARGTLSDLMVKSTFATNGGDPNTLKWVEMPFGDMTAALQRGQVDAAMMVEPFATFAHRTTGATVIADLATGPLKDLPFTAYAATAKFVADHPKTIAAFQKAMRRAASEAADRSKIEPLLPEYAKVDKETAAQTNLPGFRSALDAGRVQSVADLMTRFGVLPGPFDVRPMVLS
ncbi:ABC transporter substrate-binding protein [Actinocrispum wychmicini]|uniref:NitT/TauT family transport system substrate-binding protein n=1 Tax=Actinocrispum wychmicini TaxID=1213861 RepID=A0A4R2IRM8_9PSEU|nr:ABC transporter substrate-binding protein [Actinocrispum wychmicini]TCO47372.1 NitT/TauT family transport system substrate-binding protein [Actinocrispum wychmicini]